MSNIKLRIKLIIFFSYTNILKSLYVFCDNDYFIVMSKLNKEMVSNQGTKENTNDNSMLFYCVYNCSNTR